MPVTHERSAGFIVYHLVPGSEPAADRLRYLLLDYGRHWDFAKGHVETGETDLDAARRELAEETGIADVRVVPGFTREIVYFFRHRRRGLVRKTVVFFLAESGTVRVTLSHEHAGHAWLAPGDACRKVTYAGARALLRSADQHLREVSGWTLNSPMR